MRIEKLPNPEKLKLCRTYFMAGFVMLPLLWIINVFWFYKETFKTPGYPEQKQMRIWILSIISVVLVVTWYFVYTYNRASWGSFGDAITFVMPKGVP